MLHGDRAERRERRATGAACARSGTGACARAPTRPAPSGPGLSQIAFDTPSRPKSCTSPARRSVRTLALGEPEPRAGRGGEVGDRARVAERVRRLEVDEVRDRRQRRVELARRRARRRAPARRRSPRPRCRRASRPPRIVVGVGAQQRARAPGSNCLPRALAGERRRRRRRRRRGGRPRRTPRAARSAPRSGSPRPRARPASRGRPTARRPRRARRAPRRAARAARPARAPARAWWAIMSSTSRWPDSANSRPTRKRCSGGLPAPMQPHRRPTAARTLRELVVVLARLERDVVAEPLRLLVRVGVAADVDQQRRVVDDRALLLVEPDAARRAAARSGTGAARAPSAGRSRGPVRCPIAPCARGRAWDARRHGPAAAGGARAPADPAAGSAARARARGALADGAARLRRRQPRRSPPRSAAARSRARPSRAPGSCPTAPSTPTCSRRSTPRAAAARPSTRASRTASAESLGDLSDVRVHTDDTADKLNRSVSARAFATGTDVYFAQGEYSPGSASTATS